MTRKSTDGFVSHLLYGCKRAGTPAAVLVKTSLAVSTMALLPIGIYQPDVKPIVAVVVVVVRVLAPSEGPRDAAPSPTTNARRSAVLP